MKLAVFAIAALLTLPAVCRAQNVPPHVDAILKQIKAADRDLLAVSEEDGRFLRLLVVTRGAKRALEIGAASGYSAIWMGLGMRETGGRPIDRSYLLALSGFGLNALFGLLILTNYVPRFVLSPCE